MSENHPHPEEELYLNEPIVQDTPTSKTNPADVTEETVTLEQPGKGPQPRHELPELRTPNRKVFRMSDGTHQAVYHTATVHAYNPDKKMYEEINTILTEEKDGQHYCNGHQHFTARFNRQETNNALFSIQQDNHSVTFYAAQTGKAKSRNLVPLLYRQNVEPSKPSDTLVFEEAMPGADLEYSVNNSGIKENILVKQKAPLYHYAFDMHCENVTAAYNAETNTILYTDAENGEKVFCTPAPYMVDAAGQSSAAAIYHLHETADGQYRLTVTADKEWMNAEDRVFPVTIDPQINLVESSVVETRSWNDGELSEDSTHIIGKTDDGSVHRMCIQVNMPALPHNPRIKNATLTFTQCENTLEDETSPLLALYDTNGTLMDYQMATNSNGTYAFNVTSIVDKLTSKEVNTVEMLVQFLDESAQDGEYIVLDGVTGTTAPQLIIAYDQNYGVGTAYRTHTHDLGRFGQGSVDLQCGNLMFESEDFAWSGNRAPITIRHLFNSALSEHHYTGNDAIGLHTADFTKMQLGYGWKLNIQQSMIAKDDGYVYVNENGEQIFFEKRTDLGCCHYASENDSDMVFNCENRTLTAGGDVYLFDTAGRLIRITDQHNTCMTINYASDQLISVTDGAGRTFSLAYNTNGQLEGIVAPDGTQISYTYKNNQLTAIDYPDGRQVVISYTNDTTSYSKPCSVILRDANTELHKTTYTFQGDRVATITEYGKENNDWVTSVSTAFSYSAAGNRTMVTNTEPLDTEAGETTNHVLYTVYGFDNDGNVITEYAYTNDIDRTAVKEEPDSDTVIGVNSSDNLLLNPNFSALTSWSRSGGDCASFLPSGCLYEANSKFGTSMLKMQTRCDDTAKGMHQDTIMLLAGVYTFSAYVQVLSTYVGKNSPGAYLKVTTTTGERLAESDRLTTRSTDYSRLTTTFELTEPASVQVHILTNGCGALYAGGAQLERRPYASPFNAIVNGNFEHDLTQWCYNSNASITDTEHFNMSRSIALASTPDVSRRFCQEVQVKTAASTRETFTLSGWAKGVALPENDRPGCPDSRFELEATIVYSDYTTESYTAPFSPATEEWQFASVQFCKEKYKKVKHVIVSGFYSHNANTAYFDSIQLVRNSIETDLSEEDFVIPSDDAESANIDPDAPTEDDTFTEVMDDFGNALTETTFTEGEFGTLYRAFGYSANGNNLVSETDTRGYTTTYTVDPNTSRNEAVTDRCGNTTAYDYDDSGRTTKVTSKDAAGTELAHVGYAYDTFDNLTAIARGDGMAYNLAYTPFHDLESIGVAGKAENLVTYTYKNGTGRLKAITYANGHVMKAAYNGFGQMVAEKWYDAEETLIAHYKYVYDAEGNIVRSIDIFAAKAYDYTYDDGHVVSANAFDITLNGEMVTKRDLTHTIRYHYNKEGALTGKQVNTNGNVVNTRYTTPEDGQPEVTVTVGDTAFTSRSKTDHLGRKEFEELQIGSEFLSRQFSYHMGEVTDTHKNANKVKSTPTTQLVSQIAFSDGRTIAYEYDPEERITKVIDSVDGITEYTYDALGQLLTETVNGVVVNSMKYDNYGNIVEKNGKAYTYGDAKWKDLLTGFDGKTITYDAQGNPISYLGHTLAWEKGRQLKSFDGIEYTYNANGIRTSKVVDNVKHEYVLDGASILKETWGSNTLIPVYDNEDSVCGIVYNGTPYYFQKNLQGDIISLFTEVTITDENGQKHTVQQVVARYSYDAWGVCTIVFDTSGIDIATINPFRYRGYYYDTETGLYYVSSRYYDPEIGRWINADTVDVLEARQDEPLGLNLFTYCDNNPVNYFDPTGEILISTCVLIGIGIGALIGGAVGSIYGYNLARKMGVPPKERWKFVVGYGLGGAVVGGVIGGFMGYGIGFLCGATSTSGVALNAISKGLSSITQKTWGHIITKKHAWNLVLKNVTQSGVKNLISQTLKKGATTLIDKMVKKGVTSMIYESVYSYMGQKIVVHYAVIDGIIKISDAWVKTK